MAELELVAFVSLNFFNGGDVTGDGWSGGEVTEHIWGIVDADEARKLMEQLRGLFGEPHAEILLDAAAVEIVKGVTDRSGAVMMLDG